MNRLVFAVAILSLASLAEGEVTRQPSPYFRTSAIHEWTAYTNETFTMTVEGAGGRRLYGATVTIFHEGIQWFEGQTGVDGVYRFMPVSDGLYTYSVHQGRYFAMGGDFSIQNRSANGTAQTAG